MSPSVFQKLPVFLQDAARSLFRLYPCNAQLCLDSHAVVDNWNEMMDLYEESAKDLVVFFLHKAETSFQVLMLVKLVLDWIVDQRARMIEYFDKVLESPNFPVDPAADTYVVACMDYVRSTNTITAFHIMMLNRLMPHVEEWHAR